MHTPLALLKPYSSSGRHGHALRENKTAPTDRARRARLGAWSTELTACISVLGCLLPCSPSNIGTSGTSGCTPADAECPSVRRPQAHTPSRAPTERLMESARQPPLTRNVSPPNAKHTAVQRGVHWRTRPLPTGRGGCTRYRRRRRDMRPLAVSTWRVRGPGVLVQDTTHRAGPKAGLDRASPRRPQGDALAAAWPPLLPSSPLLCSALRGVLVVYETDRRGNNSCPKKKKRKLALCRAGGEASGDGWPRALLTAPGAAFRSSGTSLCSVTL